MKVYQEHWRQWKRDESISGTLEAMERDESTRNIEGNGKGMNYEKGGLIKYLKAVTV